MVSSIGGASPFGSMTAAAPAAAAAVPIPPMNPMTAAPAAAAAPSGGLFGGLMPQNPQMASGLQNIAPGLSRAMNGGKPVDAASPYGRNFFTGEATTEKQHQARMSMLNGLGAQSTAPAPVAQAPAANFGPAGGAGQSLQQYLQAILGKMNGGGGGL